MGTICGRPSCVESKILETRSTRETVKISQENDILLTPSLFVKENFNDIMSLYTFENYFLGEGATSQVKLCLHLPSRTHRVAKIISKSIMPNKNEVFEQVNILKNLDHPNLPRIFDLFEDKANYYIISEYYKGGSLVERLRKFGKFSETQAAEIMIQILEGLNYLHLNGIVHRDIKLANVLLINKHSLALKIIDFDMAVFLNQKKCQGTFGTQIYMAPEVGSGNYNQKCDLWSCGIILYVLLTGFSPFVAREKDFSTIKKILNSKIQTKLKNASLELKDLLLKLLEPNFNERISAFQACNHSWFNKHISRISPGEINSVLSRLKSFKRTSKLKEIFQTLIVTKLIHPDDYKTEQKVFEAIDTDNNGTISRQELIKMFYKIGYSLEDSIKHSDVVIEEVAEKVSSDLTFTNFIRASIPTTHFSHDCASTAFREFDLNGNGKIEVNEIVKYFCSTNTIEETLVSQIIKQAGITQELNLEDFLNLMLKDNN